MICIAKWATRSGKNFLELLKDKFGYTYRGLNCGGVLPSLTCDSEAIRYMENNAVKTLRSDLTINRAYLKTPEKEESHDKEKF